MVEKISSIMGFFSRIIEFIVIGAITCGVAFNIAVCSSCEFLEGEVVQGENEGVTFKLGVFRYSVGPNDVIPDTGGECSSYDSDVVSGISKATEAVSILAPIFGFSWLFFVVLTQCCCPIPCSKILMGLSATGAIICTGLVWLIYANDICDNASVECEWSRASNANILALIMYSGASVLSCCMPSPRERAAERKAAKAEKKAAEAEKKAEEAEKTEHEAEEKQKEAEDKLAEAETGLAENK